MIITKVDSLKKYIRSISGLEKVVKFLQNNNLKELPDGRYDLGDEEFVNIVCGKASKYDSILEAHKKYIDVQYVIEGEEKLLMSEIDDCTAVTPFNENDDYALFQSEKIIASNICCSYAVILFPEDAHRMFVEKKGRISKKAIFKIKA